MAMSKFETAFAAARKAGKKTFTFGGKLYNTKLKSTKATAPVPRPRSERKTRPAGMPGRVSAPSRASKPGRISAPSRASVGGRGQPQTLRNSGRPVGFSTTRYRGPRG